MRFLAGGNRAEIFAVGMQASLVFAEESGFAAGK
jgi:hypothetical protein